MFFIALIAFLASFIGSIPPGNLNMSVFSYGINQRKNAVLPFALAAAIVEFFYSLIAIKFKHLFLDNLILAESMQIFAGTAMLLIGIVYIFSKQSTGESKTRNGSPFYKGLLLSLLNPMAIPFWVLTTAYFESQNIIQLYNTLTIVIYCTGIAAGTFCLLILFGHFSAKLQVRAKFFPFLHKIPGVILITLGIINFVI